jgi:glycolate oxidase FAD binding subunit
MTAVAETLEAIVGTEGVQPWDTLDADTQACLSRAVSRPPRSLVIPRSQAELAAILRYAQTQNWRVLPYGAGSKQHWGGLVDAPDLVVSTANLNQLIDHAVGDLTVTVEAGYPFAQLQALLGQAGQFWAVDPSYGDRSTVGGIIATGDTGSLRHRYNSVRDMVLGISFVRADGELVKAGGRVVKNVAGYDLMKLLTGSYGTLGIITQVTLRVYPLPQTSETILLTGEGSAIAQAQQALLSSALTPSAMDILSPSLVEALGLKPELGLMVQFQSVSESVELQMARSQELGATLGLSRRVYAGVAERDLWQRSTSLMHPDPQSSKILCKIGIKPTQAIAAMQQMAQTLPTAQVKIHAGSGLGQLLVEGARSTQILEVRSRLGFLSLLQAPNGFKQQLDVWGYSGNALALMQQVKRQFDPAALLSPHRFVGGI